MAKIAVGVDTGGTFTDFVVLRDGDLRVHKVLSTPSNPAEAILDGLRQLGVGSDLGALVHGSTVATNAVLERKGVRTGLITTEGFRDVLEIGRQTRPKLYAIRVERDPPLVTRDLRVEVRERLDELGHPLIPLDGESVEAAIDALKLAGAESVAVCLLFSFANPEHERTVAKAARAAGFHVSASSEVLPEFREYERTSTVVLNAYVAPIMDRYLGELQRSLPDEAPLRIMQSNGGSISAVTARREAARTLLSGPAAGVVGAAYVAEASGFQRAISFDMGGTSTDVALIDGAITETTDGNIGGYPTRLPMIDIHTVGAGGGSIAWFDTGGALRVGPISAGADPGPAAYGRGGLEPTVTDANVVLGRLIPEAFLGGGMTLQVEAAREAVERIAQRLGTSVEAAALGMVRIANANMEAAIRVISVERGHDPRLFALVAFGGAGPLHACELASALRIPRVLIPSTPGVLSALGMLTADILKDYVRTVMVGSDAAAEAVEPVFAELEERGRADLRSEGVVPERTVIERYLDLRYVGQSYELVVPYSGDLPGAIADFHLAHERRFGYSDAAERVQVVNVRLKARGLADRPEIERVALDSKMQAEPVGRRTVVFSSAAGAAEFDTALFDRTRLRPGNRISGPAIITQYDTTSVLPPNWNAIVDAASNLVVEEAQSE
ncbi:MAG TPA: hydantoinase/oxoprolinase family protein [Nitrolancea sp.]|jgi:N-methylhydantoinase A|nr:hydantoinase/oxoprolinase family protein [Nitrolancea sp.]